MRAKFVNENIEFERGRDPRKAMDVGVAVENRDIFQMEKNFKETFPEVHHTHTGEQSLMAPGGPHPKWKTITASLHNPKDGISVDERKEKYLNWFKQNTDYDEFKIDSAFDRYWHPWGDETKPEQYDQQFTFHMRHKDFVNESVNFERGRDPKRSMRVGDPLTVMEMLLKDLASDPSMGIYAINPNKGHGFITITTTPLDGKYVRVSQMIDKFEELGLDKYFKYSTVEQADREKYFYFDILQEYEEYLNFPSKGQELLANPIINESYNFERGKDPRELMDVGERSRILRIFNDIVAEESPFWANINRVLTVDGFLHLIGNGPDFNKVANLATKQHHLQKYLENKVGETLVTKMEKRYPIKDEYQDLLNGLDTGGSVNETHDFKRGQDPREVMDIGDKETRLLKPFEKWAKEFHLRRADPEETSYYIFGSNVRIVAKWISDDPYEGHIAVYLIHHKDPDQVSSNISGEYEMVGIDLEGKEMANTYDLTFWRSRTPWIALRHPEVYESANFERGRDPKGTMKIGKNPDNYFNKVESVPFIKMIEEHGDWPEGEALDIMLSAGDALNIPANEVHVAVNDYNNGPEYITTRDIEMHMDDQIRDWTYKDVDDEASENFYFIPSSTGELYVCDYESQTPYLMLGSPF